MKTLKTLFLSGMLLTAVTLPGFAQITVAAPALELLGFDQLMQHVQMVKAQIDNVRNTYEQVQNLYRAEQRVINNLKAFKEIRSYDDFNSWYNRQERLEKDVNRRIDNVGVEIGTNTYKIADVEAIPDSVKNIYQDKYRDDFTEEEREKIWSKTGLSPSNYIYTKTWGAMEKKIADQILTKKDVVNEDNMEAYRRQKEIADKYKQSDENLQEKEILMGIHETTLETNRVLREMHYDQAAKNEMDLAQKKLEKVPANPPSVSKNYGKFKYAPIEDSGHSRRK